MGGGGSTGGAGDFARDRKKVIASTATSASAPTAAIAINPDPSPDPPLLVEDAVVVGADVGGADVVEVALVVEVKPVVLELDELERDELELSVELGVEVGGLPLFGLLDSRNNVTRKIPTAAATASAMTR